MFKIALQLRLSRTLMEGTAPTECDERASIAELLDSACAALSERSEPQFEIEIGGSSWPVDVRTDLSVFLEQLPALLHFLDTGEGVFTICMYEQGIEANIVINASGDSATVRCEPLIPGNTTRFDTSAESVARSAIINSASQVRDAFVKGCSLICPQLTSSTPFVDWLAATNVDLSKAP